jgi:hypothetical protein
LRGWIRGGGRGGNRGYGGLLRVNVIEMRVTAVIVCDIVLRGRYEQVWDMVQQRKGWMEEGNGYAHGYGVKVDTHGLHGHTFYSCKRPFSLILY